MLKSLAALRALFFPPAPSALELARTELARAECALLEAHSAREYGEAMATYNQRRVTRLKAALAELQPAANDTTPRAQRIRAA